MLNLAIGMTIKGSPMGGPTPSGAVAPVVDNPLVTQNGVDFIVTELDDQIIAES
jgi:hypothetical protein